MASNSPRIDKIENNLIINGQMWFWQRGTSLNMTSGGTLIGQYLADRFKFNFLSDTAQATISRDTDVPSAFQLKGYYSFKITPTATDTSLSSTEYSDFVQFIEGYFLAPYIGRTLTLSFWVKSNKTGNYYLKLFTDASGTQRVKLIPYTINAADTWEHKILTFDIPTTEVWRVDNNLGLDIAWMLASGDPNYSTGVWFSQSSPSASGAGQVNIFDSTSNYFKITAVKLVAGDIQSLDSDFINRNYLDELSLCLRYYEKSFELETAPAYNIAQQRIRVCVNTGGANTYGGMVYFKVEKRTFPTIITYNPFASNGTWRWYDSSLGSVDLFPYLGDFSSTKAFQVQANGITGRTFCEGHYTADADF